jgi:thioredoxin reductase (NADPH)
MSDGSRVTARAVVLATGVSYRRLGVPSLEALTGAGVFYSASASEARALRGESVYVVGGGNSAGQAVMHLSRYAARVTLVVRSGSLDASMSRYLLKEIEEAPNIEVRYGTEVVDGGGQGHLEWLTLRDRETGEQSKVDASGLFLLIGARPRTEWLPEAIQRDARGYVVTGATLTAPSAPPQSWPLERAPLSLETSVPGVFAVGDVRSGSVKRVASAVGEGSIVVSEVHQHLG